MDWWRGLMPNDCLYCGEPYLNFYPFCGRKLTKED